MKTIFTCLFVSVALFVSAQQNTFKVRAFADTHIAVTQIIELNDGSFVSVGINYTTSNQEIVYILKTDVKGAVLASKEIDYINDGYNPGLTKTRDGGFAICANFSGKPVLLKFNADLSIQWQKDYNYNGETWVTKLVQTPDGSYLMAGGIFNFATGLANLILKTDSLGIAQFSKIYFTFSGTPAFDIAVTSDGNYALLTANRTYGSDTVHIVKIKPDGSMIWSRNFSNKGYNIELYSFTAASDGGIVFTGATYIPDSDVKDYELMMVKYDSTGNLLWSTSTTTPGFSQASGISVTEDRDSGYLFGGEYDTYLDPNHNNQDTIYGYVVKTNVSGVLQWTKTFEPRHYGYTKINKIMTTSDGGYAACGEASFYNFDNDNFDGSFIYKLDNNFLVCGEGVKYTGTSRKFGLGNSDTAVSTADITFNDSAIAVSLIDFSTTIEVCSSSALPLQLLSFNATLQNKSVAVQWTTANEVNTSYFTVERSNNAASFTALQQVTAKGNSAGVQYYNTTDLQPLPGTSYYRLKEVDKDGKTTYSSVVRVTMLNNGVVIISPNPVRDVVRVIMQSTTNAGITCQVIDMKGTVLATQKTSVSTGRNEIIIPAASLAKGLYVLKVIENNATQTIRFVKE